MARTAVPHMLKAGFGRIVNITTSLPTMQRRNNSPYGVTKAAIEAETLIWAQELAGTGVTVNSLIPGGAADTDFVHAASRKELTAMGRTLLPPSVMVPPILWLASRLSDGVTGARFVGKLWDDALPPDEAAQKAREASVLLPATDGRYGFGIVGRPRQLLRTSYFPSRGCRRSYANSKVLRPDPPCISPHSRQFRRHGTVTITP